MYSEDEILSSLQDTKTCLKPSLIEGAGVGVFALRDIRKDESLYHKKYYDKQMGDYEIPESVIQSMVEPKMMKYIDRMCIYNYEKQVYVFDVPLFMLYTEYYVNHSHTPNIYWDRLSHELFAINDIAEGEELTTYYRPDEREWEMSEEDVQKRLGLL